MLFSLLLIGSLVCCETKTTEQTITIKDRLEQLLNEQTLNPWYPRVIDKINGGYYSNFSNDWTKLEQQEKFIVTQARHVWTLSKAFEFYPERAEYKDFARHGYEFLRDHMWDSEYGGFYQLVDSTGAVPENDNTLDKRAYGNAFAIYGLAAYYKISNDPEVLDLVKMAFSWFDEHAHDPENGGYYEYLYRDGTFIPRSILEDGYNAYDGSYVGLKDFNSSIHILEAFTELHQVWQDDTVKARLNEMFKVVSETMYDPRGFLKLYFYPDWTLVQDEDMEPIIGDRSQYTNHVTFGHDVETAFLLLEAAEVLGVPEEQIMPKAKLFVDHALEKGWDKEKGGFYDVGKYIDGNLQILEEGKNWWAQAEGLNSLLLMHTHFPDDPNLYYKKFELMFNYIDQNLIDHQNKGWYPGGIDHHPEYKNARKAHIWKGNYHTARSMMHCIAMLENQEH